MHQQWLIQWISCFGRQEIQVAGKSLKSTYRHKPARINRRGRNFYSAKLFRSCLKCKLKKFNNNKKFKLQAPQKQTSLVSTFGWTYLTLGCWTVSKLNILSNSYMSKIFINQNLFFLTRSGEIESRFWIKILDPNLIGRAQFGIRTKISDQVD